MSAPKSPLDVLIARIARLLEGSPGAGAAESVRHAVEDFMAAFQLVPKREFEQHMEALHRLEAQVAELSRRVQALEGRCN